jgi:hypothetical protein
VKPCTVGWSESEENNFHSTAMGGFYSTSGDKSILMGRLPDRALDGADLFKSCFDFNAFTANILDLGPLR